MGKLPKWRMRILENVHAAHVANLDRIARARWRAMRALTSIPALVP
jgi:hypothetical protein